MVAEGVAADSIALAESSSPPTIAPPCPTTPGRLENLRDPPVEDEAEV